MSHPNNETFSIEIPLNDPEKMEEFILKLMAEVQQATVDYEIKLSEELNVSTMTASSINYLRSRSRWTQEKEDHLIALDKAGTPMDIGLVLSEGF